MGLMDGLHWETWEDPTERWASDRLKAALVGDTPEDVKKARKSWLSISRAHDVAQCPAQHLGKSRFPRFFDPFGANELGTGAHEVMELFYKLPAEQRTEDAIKRIAVDVAQRYWDPEKLADKLPETVIANDLTRDYWLSVVLEWSLGILQVEDPTKIEMIGSEWDFKGLPSSNGVITVGSIDRVRRDLITGKIIVDDYKFGKWKGDPNPRYRDGYGMQGHWYKDVFETNNPGEVVTEVNLIYPRAPHVRRIDIAPERVQATLDSVKQTRDDLQRYADEQRFPAQPSALCGWCDLARSCPVARLRKDNALDSASKMMSSEELAIPGSKPDDQGLVTRRANVLSQEKAEREAAMAEATAKLRALVAQRNGQAAELPSSTAHSDDLTSQGGIMTQDVQAPVQPQMPTQQPTAAQPQVATAGTAQAAPAQPQLSAAPQSQRTPRIEGYVKSAVNNEGELDFSSYAARNASAIAEYAVYVISEGGYVVNPSRLGFLSKQFARIARRISFRWAVSSFVDSRTLDC